MAKQTEERVDAKSFIRGLDKEKLQAQIAEAREAVKAATGELRAMQSLLRLIEYRDGTRFGPGPGARDTKTVEFLRGHLEKCLSPQTVLDLSRAAGMGSKAVEKCLKRHPDLFAEVGLGSWKLIEEDGE